MIEKLLTEFNPADHIFLWLLGAFLIAFFIAYSTFPTILYVAYKKYLFDEPGDRSAHSRSVPTLGGVGIFISLMLIMTISGIIMDSKVMMLVMGAITILFFLGLKDDLTVLSPRKKFIGQLFAALLLIVFTDNRIIGFSNILDIETLPYWVSIGFTLFVYILIINAYNLIDGVDGLAGTIALGASSIFLILFISSGQYSLATVSVALMGSLIAFLRFNFSSKNKIFMGDTGSMLIGFLVAFLTISFISQAQINEASLYHKASPAIALAIVFYPLVDTLRVVILRVFILKRNPFYPDQNHIHHLFLKMGYSHILTTIILATLNLIVFGIAVNLLHLNLNTQIISLLLYGGVLFVLPFILSKITRARPGVKKSVPKSS